MAVQQDCGGGNDQRRREDRHGDRTTEALHALDEWRLPAARGGHRAREAADLGRCAGGHDDAVRAPARDGRPGVCAVAPVAERRSGVTEPRRLLRHRQRLAGQQGLVDFEAAGVEQAQVRRHGLPAFEQHHVSPHQLGSVDLAGAAVAHDGRTDAQQSLQSGAVPLGLPFLPRAERGIDQQHESDEACVREAPERDRARRSGEQYVDEGAVQLA